MSGAFSDTSTQLAALSAAHNMFKDATTEALRAELAKTRLDLERSCMAEEDARSANMKVFDTGLQNRRDEIREERRREETRRFWDNHHMRLGTTAGQGYL